MGDHFAVGTAVEVGGAAGMTLIRRPPWSNMTLPVIIEKIVQSRPTRTFLPGWRLRAVLHLQRMSLGSASLTAKSSIPPHLRARVAAVAARVLFLFAAIELSSVSRRFEKRLSGCSCDYAPTGVIMARCRFARVVTTLGTLSRYRRSRLRQVGFPPQTSCSVLHMLA